MILYVNHLWFEILFESYSQTSFIKSKFASKRFSLFWRFRSVGLASSPTFSKSSNTVDSSWFSDSFAIPNTSFVICLNVSIKTLLLGLHIKNWLRVFSTIFFALTFLEKIFEYTRRMLIYLEFPTHLPAWVKVRLLAPENQPESWNLQISNHLKAHALWSLHQNLDGLNFADCDKKTELSRFSNSMFSVFLVLFPAWRP